MTAHDRHDGAEDPDSAESTLLTAIVATLVAGVGLVVLVIGWWAGVDAVTRVLPNLVSMKANTATGFIAAGIALHPAARRRPAVARSAAALLVLLGAATVLEYAAGLDLGIDELLAEDTRLIATASPGRMGLNTAIGFAFLGAALLRLPDTRQWPGLPSLLVSVPFVLSLMALVAYMLRATSATGIGSATQMALHTSVTMLTATVGTFAVLVHRGPLRPIGRRDRPGALARRLLASLFAAVIGGALLTSLLAQLGVIEGAELGLAVSTTFSLLAGALLLLSAARATTDLYDEVGARSADLEATNTSLGEVSADLERLNAQLEERIARRTAALEAARTEAAAFAHTVAHDIRSPLSTLMGFLLTMRDQDLPDEMADQLLQRCVAAAERLERMVADLLAFADDTVDPTAAEADLAAAAASAVAALPGDGDDRTIEVGDLPRVRGNHAALQAILFNLLMNGIKYRSPERPVHLRIVAEEDDSGNVAVRVSDNGVGIAAEDRERVFAMGERLGGSSVGGYGVGLAIVRRLVERHHGRIWVEDGEDGGSAFVFTLPSAQRAEV